LISTKFSPPAVDAQQIARETLVETIIRSSARVVLLRAPAGFGKTTLMAQARLKLQQSGATTAWLTLDSADNDLSRFLAYLTHALAKFRPKEISPRSTKNESASVDEVAVALLERVNALTSKFTLFLDGLESIRSPAVIAFIAQLLERVPSGSVVVMGAREVRVLKLAYLRANAQLLEIDTHKLRFSLDDVRDFFNARGAQFGGEEIGILHSKTEGWAVALSFAWLALERHRDRKELIKAFSGTDDSLTEYLLEEVLASQPAEVRRLLLCTSILGEVSAPLCAVLLPDLDGGAILRQLAKADGLMVPIEGRPGHWRYHGLLLSFLHGQLQCEMPEVVPSLHLAAARWFLAQGQPVPAIEHFIAACAPNEAIQVLRREAMPLLMQGHFLLLTRWFDALPQTKQYPLLQVIHLWSMCFTEGPQAGLELMRSDGIEKSQDPEIKVHVAALQATMLSLLDRWEEAYAAGNRSLHLLPSDSAFANAALVNVTANSAVMLGLGQEARVLLERARQSQGQAASSFHRMYSETVEGLIDLRAGRLRQARARLRFAVQCTTTGSSLDTVRGNAWAGIFYAGSVYGKNDLQEAKRLLQVYLPLARDAWMSDHIVVGYRYLSRLAFAEGDVEKAFQSLSELEYLGHERRQPRLVGAARLARAHFLLLQGHYEAAAEELRSAGGPEMWRELGAQDWEEPQIAQLRWQVHAGDACKAGAALELLALEAERKGRVIRSLKLHLLHAMALMRCGDDNRANETFLRVLRPACAEGAMRLVLDEGMLARRLVACAQARLDPARIGKTLVDYLQRLYTAFDPTDLVETLSTTGTKQLPQLEPLTPKERRLLQLLVEGDSNRALAERLNVSENTVRAHLRNINGKLGVSNRTQAVAMGRRHGLVG
jgi:LuxR family transcriptional regulator, maltose regulon positive regulatory protein